MNIYDYFKIIKNTNYKLYIISKILYYAAPTIFCNKPSTIVNINDLKIDFFELWNDIKMELKSIYNIESFELKKEENAFIVMFYRRKCLDKTLKDNKELMLYFGYEEDNTLEENLMLLKKRYQKSCPHEIGIFLGIPAEDVVQFIKNDSVCKLCGYWKVYNDVETAKKIFSKYDLAKETAIKYILNNLVLGI